MRHYVIIISLLCSFTLIVISQESQFDVDCPLTCKCTKFDITCINTHPNGSDIFIPMRPEAFPELDSITVSGGFIGDISRQNLFGIEVVHKNLTLLNMSSSGITAFDNETFQGLPALQWFCLNDNSIERVGKDPFRWNLRLTRLDLSRAFSPNIGIGDKQLVLRNMFTTTNNHFFSLNDLFLNDNGLTTLSPDAFCKIEGLSQLHLSGNKLTEFPFNDNCLNSLQMLDLSNNQIVSPSVHIWNGLQSLQALDISTNPLHCDCRITGFFAKMAPEKALNQGRTLCTSPASVKGRDPFGVANFECTSHRHLVISILLLLLLLIIVAIKIYKNRLRDLNSSLVAGYTKLGTSEAVIPQYV